ncbi:hypothetical protein B0I35DRAFT_479665 [Stachybotrys elegans]|uniref:Uncharacterized protein n=1 Tax=Stachybotrys elegans TaxID=80388 RepID=A0A8K0WQ34_9HYPO|nr:hypothetical protein B0I35DRAFT_479665 [Stachybotrys elegans]
MNRDISPTLILIGDPQMSQQDKNRAPGGGKPPHGKDVPRFYDPAAVDEVSRQIRKKAGVPFPPGLASRFRDPPSSASSYTSFPPFQASKKTSTSAQISRKPSSACTVCSTSSGEDAKTPEAQAAASDASKPAEEDNYTVSSGKKTGGSSSA